MGNNSIILKDKANNNNNSSLYQTDGNSKIQQEVNNNPNTVPLPEDVSNTNSHANATTNNEE